jgi:hypothetical protein
MEKVLQSKDMSETAASPSNNEVPPEKALGSVLSLLYAGGFEAILTPESYRDFEESLGTIVGAEQAGVGEFMIQLFYADLDDPKVQASAEEDSVLWLGIQYSFVQEGESIHILAQELIYATDSRDLLEIEEYAGTPLIVIRTDDIKWSRFTHPNSKATPD